MNARVLNYLMWGVIDPNVWQPSKIRHVDGFAFSIGIDDIARHANDCLFRVVRESHRHADNLVPSTDAISDEVGP
jgi:hypothetical protein